MKSVSAHATLPPCLFSALLPSQLTADVLLPVVLQVMALAATSEEDKQRWLSGIRVAVGETDPASHPRASEFGKQSPPGR